MEHPLLEIDPTLSIDDLQTKINELNRKLMFAHRSRNAPLISQIQMAIESFSNRYQEKIKEAQASARGRAGDFSDRIDIS